MGQTIVIKQEERTAVHLLMAGIVSIFSVLLIAVTIVMPWEIWTIPLLVIGIVSIWVLHIGRLSSDIVYEYICAGLMMVEFFYYGIHEVCLYDAPVIACVLFFLLALLGKKTLLYMTEGMYVLELLYHALFLHTIGPGMGMENFVRLVLGMAGTIGAMTLSVAVINRWKQERKEMGAMVRLLEDAKQQNADFLSNVSHELRTPINMVTGISEVALGRPISPELRESMQSVQMAGRRLAGQINDILDYTEIAGNTLTVTNESYMPSSVIHDVIAAIAMQNSGCDLEMIFDLEPQVPAALIGDAEKISRVLRILLHNAVKFTDEGGIYVHVGCRRESYGVNLDITICDTGIGMTPAQLSRIYDDFYQADSSRSRYAGGLGLGVPIARGLLHAMDGFIHYRSREDQGTQVYVSIPQGVADNSPGLVISNPKRFCIVCYFKADKYGREEVRQYYDNVILHMTEGLGIQAYRVYHFPELENMLSRYHVTHLFLAREEYEDNIPYFEELGKSVCAVLIAEKEFSLRKGSSLAVIHKPLFVLPIVNLLNGVNHGKELWGNMMEGRGFSCVGVHALVVDDEDMNLAVARGILNSYGIQADTCSSGTAAVEKCMENAYDLIFLDHMMPGMDGVETLKHIRAMKEGIYQNLPIIALTANAISGAREMFKSEGFTEFVPKPIERALLERVLRRVLPEQCMQHHIEQGGRGKEALTGQEEPDAMEAGQEEPDALTAGQGEPDALTTGQGEPDAMEAGQGEPDVLTAGQGAQDALTTGQGEQDALEALRQIGLNTEAGLEYCGGEEEFYLEMLQMYCEQSSEKRKEIEELYQRQDWAGYAIKAHALKSTSLTIGAEEFSARAKAMELAGKSEDEAFIKENHEEMLKAYDKICELIRNHIVIGH